MADIKPQIRIPPHSREAEESVLGAMLLDKDAIIAVAEFLTPDDFYDERLKEVYEAILSLYEERTPVDLLTVTERLKKRKSLKIVGGAGFLSDLVNKVPTAAHVEHYGKIVKDLSTKRALMNAAAKIVDFSLDEGMGALDLLDKAESAIFSLSQKNVRQSFVPIKTILSDSFDRLDELHKQGEGLRGIPTGFTDLDNALAGMQKSNLLILAARPGVGKCVTGETHVVDFKTGKRQTIKNIVAKKSAVISTLNKNFKLKTTKPSAFVDDGEKQVYEITTALGNKLEATAIHPLLTIKGWRKVEELKEGIKIATPRKMDVFGKMGWKDWEVKSLAYFLGDGGVTGSIPRFTNGNQVVLNDFCNSVINFGDVKIKYEKQSKLRLRTPTLAVANSNPYKKEFRKTFADKIQKFLIKNKWPQRKLALSLNTSPSLVNFWLSGKALPGPKTYSKLKKLLGIEVEKIDRENPVTKWLLKMGVMGKLAIEKEIPTEVFELNKANLSLFLNRLFACEGSIMPGKIKGSGRISFASSSYKLAEGVKHLLLRFGILARLRDKKVRYKGGIKSAYELEIMGAENILFFVNEIGAYGKEKAITKIKKLTEEKLSSKSFSKDTLPLETWDLIIEEKRKLPWRQLYKRMGRPLSHNIHANRRELRRQTLKEIALALNSKKLLNLAESDIYWDRIVSIKPSGVKRVYDLTVDKTHNFIANDIVVHNTSFALNIAESVAVKYKRPVAYFSLEMSNEELIDRLLVSQADIDAWKLKTGKLSEDDFSKLSRAMGELAETPIYIDDTPALSILEMRTKARRLQVEHGIDFIVVDYLQLARSRNLENRVQEVSEISQGLKNLARELKVPVLALSQLSRGVEQRGVKKPQLSDLRESGGIEQDADVVMFLWREDDEKNENIMLDIAKHRNGPLKSIPLHFRGDRIKFYSRDSKSKE